MSDDAVDSTSRAIERLVEQFTPLLRAMRRRFDISGQETEELEQDVRIRLWRTMARDGPARPPAAYCQRIVVSAAADIARRRRGGRVSSGYGVDPAACASLPPEAIAGDVDPDRQLERYELRCAIHDSVAGLAPPRDLVVRLYLAGFDRLEIVDLLGWSEPKVRNLLYRGLNDLRVVLAARGVGAGALA